jgi:hypothetical protein
LYADKMLDASTDFFSGMKRGYNIYARDAGDAAKQAEQFMTNSMSAMEDALFNFVQSGRMDFKSLADSIIADLMRISIRMAMFGSDGSGTGGLMGLLGTGISAAFSFFGGGSSAGSPISAGTWDTINATDWSTPILHAGGVAGVQYTGYKNVDPSVFFGASRYHGGGIVGLSSNEVPVITQRGETILTPAQARTLAPENEIAAALRQALGGASGGAGGMPRVTVNVQNYSKAEVETPESMYGQGNFSMDLILKDVEKGVAKNINAGNSPIGHAPARKYQLESAGALYNK